MKTLRNYQALTCTILVLLCGCSKQQSFTGIVEHEGQPVAGATVRVKGTAISTTSDRMGSFELPVDSLNETTTITASAAGYFIGSCEVGSQNAEANIVLVALPERDFEAYEWVDPTPDADAPERCGNCHAEIFDQWSSGAHASSANGFHFLDLYAGTNQRGAKAGGAADHSWNMLRDRPEGAGVCNSCHAPSAALEDLAIGDIRDIRGVPEHGVHCDFCHKVQSVSTDNIGLTHGRFGMKLLRPKHGQLFFGPLDDVDRGEDAHGAHMLKSEYCAACHEGTVFGVHVYGTYSEWLKSPARRDGKQCQDCHMKPDGVMTNIAPDHGGIERDPMTLPSHQLFPGGKSAMLMESLRVQLACDERADTKSVAVTVTAKDVGHRVPTGFVDRHVILVVEGVDKDDRPIRPVSGPILSDMCGSLAGIPGKLFAKQLRGESGRAPVPFWAEVFDVQDTRLFPEQPDRTEFQFPRKLEAVRVRVIYRRFWESVEKEKGWPNGAIIVYDQVHPVSSRVDRP